MANNAIQRATQSQPQQPTGREMIVAAIKQMDGAVKRALPSVMTPERFTRIAVSALSTTPKLQDCHPMTFIGAMMTAAQLGLEPNTPLGQAYLIPFWNGKSKRMECQFQLGYKGMIDLAYRSGQISSIQAHVVRENDKFEYSYGLEPTLSHVPALADRGAPVSVYAVFKTKDGGFGFKVMSWEEVMQHGQRFSKSYGSGPWQTNPEEMAKKTVLKAVLKYAPLSSEFVKGSIADGTVKDQIDADMSDVPGLIIDAEDDAPDADGAEK